MTDLTFTIRVTGDSLDQSLHRWFEVMSGPGCRRILEAIGDEVCYITWENFGEAGSNRPFGWPPLSPKYQKAIGYYGPPKLILNGDLISSVKVQELTDDTVTVGSDIEYASIHQFGEGIVPARPYFPFYGDAIGDATMTPFCERRVNQVVENTVRQIVGVAGGEPF